MVENGEIPAIIINLESQKKKYDNMSEKLTKFGISYTRFNAILGHSVYKSLKEEHRFRRLRPAQVGCWQSHYSIWKRMIEQNIDKLLIFEDDCFFVKDFNLAYKNVLNMAKNKKYEILFLGYCGCKVDISNNLHLKNTGCPRCTHCYILTLSGAKKLIEKTKTIGMPVDEVIGRMFWSKKIVGLRTSYMLVYQPWQRREDKYPLPSKYTNRYKDLI